MADQVCLGRGSQRCHGPYGKPDHANSQASAATDALLKVSTAAQAKAVASLARFPKVAGSDAASPTSLSGIRGFGSPVPPSTWNVAANSYLQNADDDIVVLVQIETKEAVENIEEIAAVDGIDVLFIGPFDLSLSLSRPTPNPDPHPDVEAAIQKIKEVGKKSGKKWYVLCRTKLASYSSDVLSGIFCTSGEQAARRRLEGWDMVIQAYYLLFLIRSQSLRSTY